MYPTIVLSNPRVGSCLAKAPKLIHDWLIVPFLLVLPNGMVEAHQITGTPKTYSILFLQIYRFRSGLESQHEVQYS